MRASFRSLGKSLARRLNEVMPAGFRLTAENEWLELFIEGSFDSTISAPQRIEDEPGELPERLKTAVYEVLDSVQDSVSEHLRIPWPSTDGRKMAMPGVRVGTEAISLWYGESGSAPVLAIPEIPLTEIADKPR
jgi:hypothetical protein